MPSALPEFFTVVHAAIASDALPVQFMKLNREIVQRTLSLRPTFCSSPNGVHHPALIGAILGPAHGLTPSTRKGSATQACGRYDFAFAVFAALGRTHRAPVARGWSPPQRREPKVSQALTTAYACGWDLATTLMAYVVVFRAGDDDFGVMLAEEYDGDADLVVHEFDPFRR